MARTIPSGTPERPTQYLKPRRRGWLMLAALAAPIAVLAGVFIAYRSGYTEVASPGPVVLRHAPIESNCQECHQASFPHRVADVRCERCHDPRVSGRLGRRAAVEVIEVVDGSPAARAGLRPEDLLVELDGIALEDADDLQRLMTSDLVGRRAKLSVVRDGELRSVEVTLEELPD